MTKITISASIDHVLFTRFNKKRKGTTVSRAVEAALRQWCKEEAKELTEEDIKRMAKLQLEKQKEDIMKEIQEQRGRIDYLGENKLLTEDRRIALEKRATTEIQILKDKLAELEEKEVK